MKLIAGLGNPGAKYQNNRHNFGFMVVDSFVKNNGLSWRYNPDWMCYWVKMPEFAVIKPTTYMNRSGDSVLAVCHFYNIDSRDVLIVQDDLDLGFGKVRLSFNGSSAGHHGIESVIESLGTVEFGRLRIGIGSPRKIADEAGSPYKAGEAGSPYKAGEAGYPSRKASTFVKTTVDMSDGEQKEAEKYVLEDFLDEEKAKLGEVISKCEQAIHSYLDEGVEATMNKFN